MASAGSIYIETMATRIGCQVRILASIVSYDLSRTLKTNTDFYRTRPSRVRQLRDAQTTSLHGHDSWKRVFRLRVVQLTLGSFHDTCYIIHHRAFARGAGSCVHFSEGIMLAKGYEPHRYLYMHIQSLYSRLVGKTWWQACRPSTVIELWAALNRNGIVMLLCTYC
jgi:hypothetical protein